jgi:hypothetical protein
MTMHSPDDDHAAHYREDHCILRWPMATAGLIAPAAAVVAAVLAVVLQVTLHSQAAFWIMLIVMMAALLFWIARGQLLVHWWPIGIRLGADGVAIGGVRWAERHPGRTRRKASVLNQGYQMFSCPWDGITSISVETGPGRLKDLRRHATYGRKPTPLGNLSVPFMTAALVIDIRQSAAALPRIHRARNPFAANYSSDGYHQGQWVVPTRHPGRLREVLDSLPPAGNVVTGPEAMDPGAGPGPRTL